MDWKLEVSDGIFCGVHIHHCRYYKLAWASEFQQYNIVSIFYRTVSLGDTSIASAERFQFIVLQAFVNRQASTPFIPLAKSSQWVDRPDRNKDAASDGECKRKLNVSLPRLPT